MGSLLRKIPVRRSSWNGLASADILGEAGSRAPSSVGRGRSSVHRLGGSPSRSHTPSAALRVFTARSLPSNGCVSQGRQTGLASRQVPSPRGVPGAAGNSAPPCVLLGRRPQVGSEGAPQRAECGKRVRAGRVGAQPSGEGRRPAVLGREPGWWLRTG